MKADIYVGLDIGTTKIAVIVAQKDSSGKLDIIGIGSHASRGLRKGVVVNIESTIKSIEKAVEEAEAMAGCEISSVCAGIAGAHIESFNSHGVVAVKNHEVTDKDIERVIDAAKAVAIPMDREILHVLPQEYIVDNQDGIKEPLGMSGVRLEAKVHIITGAVTSAENIIKSADRVGLDVTELVLEPLASAEAVLSDEEKELGVALIDIGGGTTDVTVFQDGSVRHTSVLPLGGNHLTSDVASGLRTPSSAAEQVKIKHGCSLKTLIDPSEKIEVASTGGRPPRLVPRSALVDIIQPRMEEIMSMVQRDLIMSGYDEVLAGGVVLTGGSVLLNGTKELAENIFNLPVRIGYPSGVGGLVDVVNSPSFSTGVGLVKFAASQPETNISRSNKGNAFMRVKDMMSSWLGVQFR